MVYNLQQFLMKYETFMFGSDYRKYHQRYSSQIMPQCRIMNQKAGSKFDIKSVFHTN